jgi:uncharacterized membrane protein (DUF4010 family)
MDLMSTFASLGIALGLGLLVGLQREQVAARLAGLRTFALITIFGTICALLAVRFGGWIVAAGLLALTGALLMGRITELKGEKSESGITTEVAALAMFGVGAYLVFGYREAAIAVGGGIAVLLHFKGQLHGIAARLGEDSKSIMQFVLISLVILPILPNRTYGIYNVVNPRQVWLMVVLVVGIGLAGYIAYKFFGATTGLLLAGILGGIISSTATTGSYSKRTATKQLTENAAAIVILLASTISCSLALLEIGVVAPGFLRAAAVPLLLLIATLVVLSSRLWFSRGQEKIEMPHQSNPSEIRSAVYFAIFYAVILLAIAAVKVTFGVRGMYTVAGIAGIAEVHALVLSTSQLVQAGRVSSSDGWRIIVVALSSSLAFKVAIAALFGSRLLWRKVALPCVMAAALGTALVLWR